MVEICKIDYNKMSTFNLELVQFLAINIPVKSINKLIYYTGLFIELHKTINMSAKAVLKFGNKLDNLTTRIIKLERMNLHLKSRHTPSLSILHVSALSVHIYLRPS